MTQDGLQVTPFTAVQLRTRWVLLGWAYGDVHTGLPDRDRVGSGVLLREVADRGM